MKRWIQSNWFLLALVVAFSLGHFAADSLLGIVKQPMIRSLVVMLVMWAMGVTLRPDAIKHSLRNPGACLLAIGMSVFAVPLLCLPAMTWLSPEMGGGLFVAGLVPCTLASASVWTRKAGGDDSISILTTTVTNLACLVVVPVGIGLVLSVQTKLSPMDQMQKLAWFVVLPLVLAQVMRRLGMAEWADRNKTRLSTAAQFGILFMVLAGAAIGRSFADPAGGSADGSNQGWVMLLVIASAVAVHLIALVIGILLAQRMGLPRDRQIAVGISGSQKTLMVGLQIAIDCGVSIVPMMVYHLGQLVIDTVIVQKWKARSEPPEEDA